MEFRNDLRENERIERYINTIAYSDLSKHTFDFKSYFPVGVLAKCLESIILYTVG